jgi:hypothetical protein
LPAFSALAFKPQVGCDVIAELFVEHRWPSGGVETATSQRNVAWLSRCVQSINGLMPFAARIMSWTSPLALSKTLNALSFRYLNRKKSHGAKSGL